MKTKLEDLNIPAADQKLVRSVASTRCKRVATLLVKAAICRRDQLLGKDPEVPEFRFEKVKESKSRARAKALVDAIMALEDRKSVSVVCGTAILTRKACRAKAKG